MRWITYLVCFVLIVGFVSIYQLPNVCDSPVPYRIGTIDSRFNLSKEDVQSSIAEAEQYWEKAMNRDLFVYSPTDEEAVTVRMIYDERQNYSAKVNEQKAGIDKEKDSLQQRVADFNRRSDNLERRVAAFNQKVQDWNRGPSQTEEDYNKLVEEQNALENETVALNAEARTLQQTTRDYNLQVDKLNDSISSFQEITEAKPEEGLYESATNTITIFYHNGHNELVHTIAHELGHVLGIEHVSDPYALMYARVNETLKPTNADLVALREACKKETILQRSQTPEWQSYAKKRFNFLFGQ